MFHDKTLKVFFDEDLLKELENHLNLEKIELHARRELGLDFIEVVQYLVMGGGLVSIANTIIQYKKMFQGTRKIEIEAADFKISIESPTTKELVELLEKCEKITIKKLEKKDEKE